MGKNLRSFLAFFVATLGALIMIFSSQGLTVKATDYQTNDLLSDFTIAQKDYGTASNVETTFYWDATGKNLQNGDTWTIDLPDTLKVKNPGETIPLYDKNNNLIGNAVLNSDNTIKVTFTDVEGKNDFSGSITVGTGIGVGKDAVIGDNNVIIGDKNQNMTVTLSDSDISKKGVIGTDENGDPVITWTILVNRNSEDLQNLSVSDHLSSLSANQQKLHTYIPGSVNVYEAHWTQPGYYKKDRLLDPSEYTLNETSDGFDINLPKGDQFYAITMQTKINDPSNATDMTKFRNHADMSWYPNTSNGNGTAEPGSSGADASVTGNKNSGNGNGNDIKGSVTLKKSNTSDETQTLAGAVYDLYKVGSNTPVKTGLTTDENGQLTVTDLDAGNYYFKETKAPDGYQINNNEILFTITGQTTTPVQVTAKDEPEGVELGSVSIEKVDSVTRDRLQGAEFEILDSDGKVVATLTTDENGVAYKYELPVGKYTLRETKAPAGYIAGGDVHFEITADNLTPAIISVENELEYGGDGSASVILQKFDSENMTIGVPGATYALYDATTGEEISREVTDESGIIRVDDILPGNYYFVEVKAPDGFDINPEKLYFTVPPFGETSVGTIETSDDPLDTDENGGNGTDPDENNGNEGNNNGGGIIVDPSKPGSGDNGDNNGGLVTNPTDPKPPYEGNNSNDSNYSGTLPQTGATTGTLVTIVGLIILSTYVYFRKRRA